MNNQDIWKVAVDAEKSADTKIGDVVKSNDPDLEHLAKDGYKTVDLDTVRPSQEAIETIPERTARKHRVFPIEVKDGYLEVATPEPTRDLTNLLNLLTKYPVRLVVASPMQVAKAIDVYYSRVVSMPEGTHEQAASMAALGDDTWASKTVDACLEGALKAMASDVHLDPQDNETVIRYRIDGMLRDAGSIKSDMYTSVVSRIKVLGNMNVVEHLSPQDGQIVYKSPSYGSVDVRVSVLPTIRGEKVVMRVLDKRNAPSSLDHLGFDPKDLSVYRKLFARPHGMIMIVGPTGSGKTTTLYNTIREMDRESLNVMTLEDPVEFQFPRVVQVQVNPRSGLTFASGLRAFLRQDPNVIAVGEIRDKETAEISVNAALTGHLVLCSIHAMDCVSGLYRLVDMGIEPYFVAAAVTGLVSQRLIRRVCPNCKEEYALEPMEVEYLKELGVEPPAKGIRGKGCSQCAGSGFSGRVGIYEVLAVNDEIRSMLIRGDSRQNLKEAAVRAGMTSLARGGVAKALMGITTVSEVVRDIYE